MKHAVSLVWNRPKHDGGSKLIGYYVEFSKIPGDKWERANSNAQNVATEEYTVNGLDEGAQYKFRIIAKTAINVSHPSEESDVITVIAEHGKYSFLLLMNVKFLHAEGIKFNVDLYYISVPPRVEISLEMKNLIIVKAGSNVCLEAEVYGKPLPKVTWKRDGVPLTLVEGMKMSQKRHLFLLELFSVTRKETGEYTILAENPSGSKSGNIRLKVLGKMSQNNGLFLEFLLGG